MSTQGKKRGTRRRRGRAPASLGPAVLAALLLGACGGEVPGGRHPAEVMVFAAASLREVAEEAGRQLDAREGIAVTVNAAGSNTLAQQIAAAPTAADVFLSADESWVRYLEDAGLTEPDSRRILFANTLVAVAREDSPLALAEPADLARGAYRHLALADPAAVPAGRYAREALERIPWEEANLWAAIEEKIVPALDVRAALALAEADPEVVAIIYSTDARSSKGVRELFELPAVPGRPIVCYGVLLAGRESDGGRRYLRLLTAKQGHAIAARHGFRPMASQ